MPLPADIEALVTEDGAYIEIASFIKFLRDDSHVTPEYKVESAHLKKIADYLEDQLVDLLSQKRLLNEIFDESKPN